MEWIEANPLPEVCRNCQEEDCYNCDYAGERWTLSQADELRIRRKGIVKAIDRLKRQLEAIDAELEVLENGWSRMS